MSALRVVDPDIVERFQFVLKKIIAVPNASTENKDKLHIYFDELSSFNYKKPLFSETEIICKTFTHLIQLVPETDSTLSAKTCQLLSRLYHHSQGLRLPIGTSNSVLYWCLRVLATAGELAILDCMAAIEMLLKGRAMSADPQALSLLLAISGSSSVVAWLSHEKLATLRLLTAAEVELAALRVVKAIASPIEPGLGAGSMTPARIRRLETCAAIFVTKLTTTRPVNDLQFYKSATVCLKGMQAVVLQRCSSLPLSEGLGLVQAFWLIGLPEYDPSSFPPSPAQPGPPPPSSPAVKGPRSTRGGGPKHARRVRTALARDGEDDVMSELPRKKTKEYSDEDISIMWLSALSDSEDQSDTEIMGASTIMRQKKAVHSTVRFAALRLLLLLIKTGEQQSLMSYWDLLMPYSPPGAPPSPRPSISCSLLRDTFVCSRTAAALCIEELLLRCQLFLTLAEASSGPPLAFTPWSHNLAMSLDSCQRCLTLALASEKVSQCIVTTLGAMSALAAVTPFHRLPPGPLTRLARSTRPQLFHKSLEVRAAALAVFASIASSAAATHQLAELKTLLNRPPPANLLGASNPPAQTASGQEESEEVVCFEDDDDDIPVEFIEEEEPETVGRTWLVEFCLNALQMPERSKRFRLEPCRTLAAIARTSLWILLGEGGAVMVRTSTALAQITVQETDQNVQITASRALMDLSQSLSNHLQQPGDLSALNAALEMWAVLLQTTVPQLASSTSTTLRALACDLLASMGPTVYEHLPREQRLLLAFHLFALSRDTVNSVCTSAVRALGICVIWPALIEDEQFVLDAAEYVAGAVTSKDEILKSRAAWAMGNLGETLVACRERGLAETIPEHLLMSMLESALDACKDEKLKAYAVRGLGNLLRLLSTTQLRKPECKDLVSRCILAIVECASSPKPSLMKVRWNACHALACVLRGPHLCEDGNTWQMAVFPMLCDLVVSSPNFKVRISAAVALAAPSCRTHYTTNFLPAWSALLEALASADNVQDFREFQHRDNLVDQICLSLSHLALCLNSEDLSGGINGALAQLVLGHEHQLRTQLERVRSRLVPEKAEPLSKAGEHLGKLATAALSPGVKEAANQLATVFSADSQQDFDL